MTTEEKKLDELAELANDLSWEAEKAMDDAEEAMTDLFEAAPIEGKALLANAVWAVRKATTAVSNAPVPGVASTQSLFR